MYEDEAITLERDCGAVLIPQGTPIMLPAGSVVFITQALGGSYTVSINGNLARIDGRDADALGFEVPEFCLHETGDDGDLDESLIWSQLKTCFDPEIPINIVDLGLIYECESTKVEEGKYRVQIKMTLTAPGCGMGQFLVDDVRSKIERVSCVSEVNVELVFDPPWDQSMMSEAARLQTGMY